MEDDAFLTADGTRLRARLDLPPGPPRAAFVLVHGLGDQVDGLPYATAAAALAARGFAVLRLELRGHGRSGGPRVHVQGFEVLRDDLRHGVAHARASMPAPLPLFLAGVSLGGLIVIDYAIHHPEGLAGVVAVAPALGETGGSPLLRALVPVLARLVPRLRIDPRLDLDNVTRDPALRKAYVEDDPLYQRRITPRLAAALLAAIPATRARAMDLRVPLLVLHGTGDTIASPAGSRSFCEEARNTDRTYRAYEGAFHNLFVDTNREEVFDDIASWAAARA